MKNVFFFLLLSLAFNLSGQTYNLSISNGTYEDITGSTSLNNGETWDDPGYAIPIGFAFEFFDETLTTIYINEDGLGATLSSTPGFTGKQKLLVPYGADIIDRGDDIGTSMSNISYVTEGVVGNRILKIEWNNVGFYGELSDNNTNNDFTNFQLWLYEESNEIEIHFGETSNLNPNLNFDGLTGTNIALLDGFDFDEAIIENEGLCLQGAPTEATILQYSDINNITHLEGIIPNGTIYTFSKMTSSTLNQELKTTLVSIHPNPTRDQINLSFSDELQEITNLVLLNNVGQVAMTLNHDRRSFDVSNLSTGLYFIQLQTESYIETVKFLKD